MRFRFSRVTIKRIGDTFNKFHNRKYRWKEEINLRSARHDFSSVTNASSRRIKLGIANEAADKQAVHR